MIPLLLAALLTLQDPAPPAAPKAEWRDVDGLLFILNEDTITKRAFINLRARFMVNSPNVDAQRANRALQEEIKNNAVGSQSGEAMGIEPAMVKRSVRDYERRLIERAGGVDQYSEDLRARGMTAEQMRAELEKQVLREMWEDSRTGKGPNQQQRTIADRFVRPGSLRLSYTQIAQNPRAVSLIGGSSSKVVLEILQVDPVKVGGTSQAESSAKSIRDRIAAGTADFEHEGSNFAVTGSKPGQTEPLDEASLASTDPQLARLVTSAKEGEVLPALAPHDSTLYWRIVRLVKRVPADVPGFKTPGVQKQVREFIREALDTSRLERAREKQFESSYIWIWPPAAVGR